MGFYNAGGGGGLLMFRVWVSRKGPRVVTFGVSNRGFATQGYYAGLNNWSRVLVSSIVKLIVIRTPQEQHPFGCGTWRAA